MTKKSNKNDASVSIASLVADLPEHKLANPGDMMGFAMNFPEVAKEQLKVFQNILENDLMTKESLGPHYDEITTTKEFLVKSVDMMAAGHKLKDICQLTDDQVESFYQYAYQLYNSGKYDDSLTVFEKLCTLDPYCYKFALGISACYQMKGEYAAAVRGYMMAASIEPQNPYPNLYAYECLLNMKEPYGALIMVSVAVDKAKESKKYNDLHSQCLTLKKMLLKTINESGDKKTKKKTKSNKKSKK